eukprot:SM000070S21285  [mRNA]  locus=s70:22412:31223:- [translate_table: standard]
MLCCDWEKPGGPRVAIGHSERRVTLFDLHAARAASQLVCSQGVGTLRSNGRLLALGGVAGEVALVDVRSGRSEAALEAHSGGVTAVELRGDLLATCGVARRLGQLYADPLVFDVRQTARALTHVPFAPGPSVLKFHPTFSSVLLIASASGAVVLTDVQGSGLSFHQYQVDCEGDALLAADISSSGQLVAFGDAGGYVHLWGASALGRVNLFSQPIEVADHPTPIFALSEADSFALAYRPITEEMPLSTLDPNQSFSVGMPPRTIDGELLEQMNVVDFVGYVQNPRWRRGLPYGEAMCAVTALRNTRQQLKDNWWMDNGDGGNSSNVGGQAVGVDASGQPFARPPRLPKGYGHVEIKQSRSHKFEEFDFSYYNRTRFAGLENDVLYFIPALRAAVTSHVCEVEFCLTCELGFVLHMLDLAEGDTCQPTNLLRALRQIKEAVALGLVEGPDEYKSFKEKSVSKRIQALSRFLLEQLHKEAGAAREGDDPRGLPEEAITDQLFGMSLINCTKCMRSSHEVVQERRSFQVDLQYPAQAAHASTFAQILERSLCRQEDMRAWCQQCRGYQHVHQVKVPQVLPKILIVNCCVHSEAELSYWQTKEDIRHTPLRQRTSKHWLPFHIEIVIDVDRKAVSVSEIAATSPSTKTLGSPSNKGSKSEVVRAVYELTAMVANIRDNIEEGPRTDEASSAYDGHLVAHIKILRSYLEGGSLMHSPGSSGHFSPTLSPLHLRPISRSSSAVGQSVHAATSHAERTVSAAAAALSAPPAAGMAVALGSPSASGLPGPSSAAKSKWMLFNDFCITPTPAQEVVSFYGKRKIPCLLYYTQIAEVSKFDRTQSFGDSPSATPAILSESEREQWRSPLTVPPPSSSQHLPRQLHLSLSRSQNPTFSSPIPDTLFQHLMAESSQRPQQQFTHQNAAPSLWPVDLSKEQLGPGMLLGIDAEFVALSPAAKEIDGSGVEYLKRPARLSLARVSVVRGDGPHSGICCVDDYIRTVEPVHDYLTRFSGIVPGDLDPSSSKHPVTTLKKAYLKLRFLVDKGCRFVGHGLKKDFRIINIVVPRDQVVDTVDLFHLKRQRKLSLRFLASYLLNIQIQSESHDSIEDACTALRLYEKYKQLVASGEFQEKLLEIYRYGRRHGWEFVRDVTTITTEPFQAHVQS